MSRYCWFPAPVDIPARAIQNVTVQQHPFLRTQQYAASARLPQDGVLLDSYSRTNNQSFVRFFLVFMNSEHYVLVNMRGFNMREQIEKEPLISALAALQRQAGLMVDFKPEIGTGEGGIDGWLSLTKGERVRRFAVQVKHRLSEAALLLAEMEHLGEQRLFVTSYVSPPMADRLKERGIFFLDAAGNGYFTDPHFFYFVKGNKPETPPLASQPRRAFQVAGLKVIYVLLCQPGLEKRPYREIAAAAGVALGSVNRILLDLRQLGYLADRGKSSRQLVRKEDLAKRWVTAYPEQLRPKLRLGCYRADDAAWWRKVRIGNYGALWGGEIAAAELTGSLKPAQVTIYSPERPDKLLLDYRLRKDESGPVEILQTFWPPITADMEPPTMVHPLLVYADLLASGFGRNLEIAQTIWEQELARYIVRD